jgi:YD repeat-containing protein
MDAACGNYRKYWDMDPQVTACGTFRRRNVVQSCSKQTNEVAPPPAPGYQFAGWVTVRSYYSGIPFISGAGCGPTPQTSNHTAPLFWRGGPPSACPPNATSSATNQCTCDKDYLPSPDGKGCAPKIDVPDIQGDKSCPWGNPIYPLEGSKSERLGLTSLGGVPLDLVYDSRPMAPVRADLAAAGVGELSITQAKAFGTLWSSTFHRLLRMDPNAQAATAVRGDGRAVGFRGDGTGAFSPVRANVDQLSFGDFGWRYYDSSGNALETYERGEGITKRVTLSDARLTFTYSTATTLGPDAPEAGLLTAVSDAFGRTIQYRYESVSGNVRVKKLLDPNGRELLFEYDSNNNLKKVTWPDGTAKVFKYENSAHPWALTGIVDENDTQYAFFSYDALGRAISTAYAGDVNKFEVSFGTAPTVDLVDEFATNQQAYYRRRRWNGPVAATVTLPNGETSSIAGALAGGTPKLSTSDQPSGSGCAASSSSQSFDPSGNVASRDDFNGHRACYTHDQARNVELVRVEGLAGGTLCDGVTGAGVALPSGSRKVSTEWHPEWRLKTKVAEPSRRTTYVYQGQDPLGTGTAANCLVAGATPPTLPGGQPLALLCKQVEQATTDADGSQGLTAALQPGVPDRVRSWTYNENGQVLTEKDPLNNITTYLYYPTTTFTGTDPNAEAHTKGDLQEVTNAAGKKTQYTLYNRAGQVVEMKDGNNVITRNTYDARQRLASASVGGQTTNYEYWPTGLLKKVTKPDGVSFVEYTYDDAHRLKTVRDNRNNEITYSLDNLGNRTGEQVKDPTGTLRRQLARDIDALGRVQLITGRE